MEQADSRVDVAIIGAGPAGAIASALLNRKGYSVCVLERAHFPRFSIGESLLPQCMVYIREAGMLEAVEKAGFQFKNGAAFGWDGRYTDFHFEQKFSDGPGTTFQVQRADFDKLLADEAERQGVDIRYGHTITDCQPIDGGSRLHYNSDAGETGQLECRFVLDASGFGRVLPKLFDLETPSDFPVRQSAFTHIEDRIDDPDFDRNKILITVHPKERDIWYWLIPFSDGRCSLGVVARCEQLQERGSDSPEALLKQCVAEVPDLSRLLQNARWDSPARQITGYSANVSRLADERFALLGNAGEFLDPVFSSGVTIAMRSASEAVSVLARQLEGESVDWLEDYEKPLRRGVETFRVFVEAWYDGLFQDLVFYPEQATTVRDMICSILAGYAWDEKNPFVADPRRRMSALAQLCIPESI